MIPTKFRLLILVLLVNILIFYLSFRSWAAERCEEWVGKAVSVKGSVQARGINETTWNPVQKDDIFCIGDMIRVQRNSRATFVLYNGTKCSLDQGGAITFSGLEKKQTLLVRLYTGAAHFFSRIPRSLKLTTPFVNGSVEGTEFYVKVEEDHTLLSIFEGRVAATNEAGSLILTSGQSAIARAGQAPEIRIVVRPRDAVHWALYYPAILDYRPADFQNIERKNWQEMVRKSIEFYWSGDLSMALSSLDEAPEDINNPRFFTYRSGLLLSVGRVDEASDDIETALKLDPSNSHAFSLQAIIAMVQNRKDQSLELAEKAVAMDPKSSVARVALSYSKQAHFDLEGALKSLIDAVNLDPENALALARLSELWLSLGYMDKALEVAQKAAELNPNQARTQTVLGFAYLTQIKTKESKSAFEKAITLDSAAPLPRLGLGLAKIRDGELEEGRQEIEIAMALDPNNSLIRSYLGKAYFEEKRDKLAADELSVAKDLDPNDPTPWFYDAIRKQTLNHPVEALYDLQKAIELNDNRAVYRSELQLDSDLAARSASIARIYKDLGFEARGLFEGWMSVNTDPGNYSAHRFLADTYATLPRHEVARVSELLQSQLLQPINITPLQPGLAESNLYLISAGGAADLSFREYNPLFNRNRVTLQATGLYGENENGLSDNDTLAGEVIASGIYKKISFSAGYSHFETNGWRPNADQEDYIGNIFAQLELTHKTSVQAEYRYRKNKRGETQMRFEQDDFRPNFRNEDETDTIRAGFRHAFSPPHTLIGNFTYQDANLKQQDKPDPIFRLFDRKLTEESYGGEIQYLYRSNRINIMGGVGYFDQDKLDTAFTEFFFPTPPFPPPPIGPGLVQTTTTLDRSADHTNIYLYSYINYPEHVTWTIGGSGDFFAGEAAETPDVAQFNPKLGIIWNPIPNTTLRGAVFRVMKRTLLTDQTLEPTQVAGFNQFFDDLNATDAWRYGVAIDQKFSQSIYGGAEYARRDLNSVFYNDTAGKLREVKWDEDLFRAYFYWAPHKWLGLNGEYLYERFERDENFALGAKEVKTHYVPLGINFFHPSGLSAGLRATYVNQKGSFSRVLTSQTFDPGEDNFWVVDVSINYRISKRYGFITVGVTNLFDEEFKHFDTDVDNPRFQPDRFLFVKATLVIP